SNSIGGVERFASVSCFYKTPGRFRGSRGCSCVRNFAHASLRDLLDATPRESANDDAGKQDAAAKQKRYDCDLNLFGVLRPSDEIAKCRILVVEKVADLPS
ncbi:MAG: hypothetical protein HQ495_07595, partial [Alphaproteobacteria bacterium]|nr:hypothetical protein [Alphaproteobacteria bacterium]